MTNRMETVFGGVTWVYQADITNGGGGGGDTKVVVTPGIGVEFEVLYGYIQHDDGASRVMLVAIRDDNDAELCRLIREALTSGIRTFPASNTGEASAGARFIVSGEMHLIMQVGSLAASKKLTVGLACRIRGTEPGAAETGNSTPTININTERVF